MIRIINLRIIGVSILILSIIFSSCVDDETVLNDEIIKLQILNSINEEIDSVIGDGTTLITLKAQIPSNASDDFKTITFKSTNGIFFGTNENMIQKRADIEGFAEVYLTLPLDSGSLFLTAEVGKDENLYKAEKVISLIAVDDVINLSFKTIQGQILTEVPRADGTSLFQLEGTILADQDNLNSITFNATGGIFQQTGNNTVSKNTNEDGVAVVNYKVPQTVGSIFYSAKTGNSLQYINEANIIYERAHADEIFIEPTTLNMNTSSGNLITVFLERSSGKVSIETGVEYEAFQNIMSEEVPVGRFTGLFTALSDVDGKVTATFYGDTGDIDFLLPVTIRVSTITDLEETIFASVDVNISE